jgi:hypothetical protein
MPYAIPESFHRSSMFISTPEFLLILVLQKDTFTSPHRVLFLSISPAPYVVLNILKPAK